MEIEIVTLVKKAPATVRLGLDQPLRDGLIRPRSMKPLSHNEFTALLRVESPMSRLLKFRTTVLDTHQIWVPYKGDSLFVYDVVSANSRIVKAAPFWPRVEYGNHVKEKLNLDFELRCVGLVEWLDRLVDVEMVQLGARAAQFWMPPHRTYCEPARRLLTVFAEILFRFAGLPDPNEVELDEKLYKRIMRRFGSTISKNGPKGKLP